MRIKKFQAKESEDKIIYGNGIVDEIVLLAVAEVPYCELYSLGQNGYTPKSDIKVTIDKESVNVEVTVKIHYTQSVSEMAFKIQEAIKHNVENMTDYRINSVNVFVKGVIFEDVNSENNNDNFKNGNGSDLSDQEQSSEMQNNTKNDEKVDK